MTDDGLTAGAVARRLGVAVTTLRTWHQRYGLGPSEHVPGHHRRYTAEDLDRLQVMRRLTVQGVAPAEAAAWARRAPLPAVSPAAVPALSAGPAADPAAAASAVSPGSRQGGGQVIALGPQAAPAARGVARAAMHLDAAAMRDILDMVLAEHGVIGAWNQVMMPVLIGIGDRYQATRRFVEVEHLISRCITEALGAVRRPHSSLVPAVLLAAADEEQHTLPLEALAAALAEAGIPTRLLGARVPTPALLDAIDRTGPEVVVLWSQSPATGDPNQLTRAAASPRPPLLTGAAGPGWPTELPTGVARLTTLPEAVDVITSAVSAGHSPADKKGIPI
ncbi:MerR family transcriptional regulator [Actinoplanes sp. NPDC051411]|uniref:MerR family transcriptional regulator n=1 Tax=Actinoplanes sp. NPDC051411 TaxID=3155522 RepID=UPI003413BD30